jgi:biotin transport system substrate-specific component
MSVRTQYITITAMYSAIICMSAFIRIPINPVPLTFQSEAVLITGYVLGPKYGAMATILYTLIGLTGIPVFASGGGPAYIFSPTFGFIIGFTFCALATGYLSKFNPEVSLFKTYIIMIAALPAIYIPGIIWLVISLHWIAPVPHSIVSLLKAGLLIPFAGDIIGTMIAAFVATNIRRKISRTRLPHRQHPRVRSGY